jgi:uncharacterized protein (DUF488 family)
MMLPFFTIGHSNRTLEEFVDLLGSAEVRLVADIRTVPRSRANPQFNMDALGESLPAARIAYEHMPALGGLRGRSRAVASEVNALWSNDSFHNYADYALGPEFAEGLAHLVERGRELRTVIMCSEAVWWRCHRRIVADYLLARGETVLHIMGKGRLEPARLTAGAVIQPDSKVLYPSRTTSAPCAQQAIGVSARHTIAPLRSERLIRR